MSEPVPVEYEAPAAYGVGMVVEKVAGAPGWPFAASRFEVPPGATSDVDQHDEPELWLVREGTGTITSGETTVSVGPGAMVHFPSRVPHRVTNTGSGPLLAFSVWWDGPAPEAGS